MRSPVADRIRVVAPAGTAKSSGLSVIGLGGVPRWPGLFREVAWYARLSAFVRSRKPSSLLILPAPGMMFRYPPTTLVICHDLIHRKFKNYLGRWGYRKRLFSWRDRNLSNASHLIADSVHTGDELMRLLGDQAPPLAIIPLWVPVEFRADISKQDRETVKRRYGLPPRYWLYVGGYDYRKNLGLLIRAYAQVRRQGACPALILAGRIPQKKDPTVCDVAGELNQAGLGFPDVIFPGFIETEDVPALYAGAELLVYPSRAEGFGLPPLEAMACGCPAIVADQTSLPEVVTDAEYRFPADRSEGLTALLSTAREQALPLNPGFDRAYFNEDRAAREYLKIINLLLARQLE